MSIVPYISRPPAFDADWLADPAEIAARVGNTEFVPQALRGNIPAITAALLYGAEIGLGPMASLSGIVIINGQPRLYAEKQRALILAQGHDIWVEESTISKCTIVGQRKGSSQASRVTWTMDDARRANLAGKQSYRLYPRQMLLARASAELATAIFPDVIGGLKAVEETDDNDTAGGAAATAEPEPTPRKTRRRASVSAPASTPAAAAPPTPTPIPVPGDTPTGVAVLSPTTAPSPGNIPFDQITDNQRTKLHAMFRERGVENRDERLAYCSQVVEHAVPSMSMLTQGEARKLIDHLEANWPLGDIPIL